MGAPTTTPLPGFPLEVDLGRSPARLPEPVDLDSSYGRLHLEIAPLELGYRVAGSLHLQPGLVPADAMPAFSGFLRDVERHLRRPLEVP